VPISSANGRSRKAVDADLALDVFRLIRDRIGHDSPISPGHSYWMVEGIDARAAQRIWEYQLRPYLAEYWFERLPSSTSSMWTCGP